VGPGRWSARSERAFLAELTATANIKAAARAAGVSTQAAYNRRRLWPAFAEAWREALTEGYVRLETLLIHAATSTPEPEPAPEDVREAPIMSVEQAMNLFKLHRASQQDGKPQRYAWRQQEPYIEEVRAGDPAQGGGPPAGAERKIALEVSTGWPHPAVAEIDRMESPGQPTVSSYSIVHGKSGRLPH
jgi:hypothetical protein